MSIFRLHAPEFRAACAEPGTLLASSRPSLRAGLLLASLLSFPRFSHAGRLLRSWSPGTTREDHDLLPAASAEHAALIALLEGNPAVGFEHLAEVRPVLPLFEVLFEDLRQIVPSSPPGRFLSSLLDDGSYVSPLSLPGPVYSPLTTFLAAFDLFSAAACPVPVEFLSFYRDPLNCGRVPPLEAARRIVGASLCPHEVELFLRLCADGSGFDRALALTVAL